MQLELLIVKDLEKFKDELLREIEIILLKGTAAGGNCSKLRNNGNFYSEKIIKKQEIKGKKKFHLF